MIAADKREYRKGYTIVETSSQSSCSYIKLPDCKDIHILAVTVLMVK